MGHTNSTANLSLPQFIGTDKPTWLGDINGAFSAIDAYAGTNDAAVAAAASDATSAISQASAAVNTANTANTTAGNASTTANNAIGVANTANAIAGTVDAKVGLLADLNTTDRTSIVNAINEIVDDRHGLVELWANPDITANFAPQTINIDLTPYDEIWVIVEPSLSELVGAKPYCFDPASFGNTNILDNTGLNTSAGIVVTAQRDITLTSTGITFGDGYLYTCSTYGSAATQAQNSGRMVPVRILGLIHND